MHAKFSKCIFFLLAISTLTTGSNAAAPVVEVEPIPYEPVSYEPVPYEPVSVEPVSYEPVPYEPVPYEPVPYEPVPYEPVSVEPVPYEPVSVEPVPYEKPEIEFPHIEKPIHERPHLEKPHIEPKSEEGSTSCKCAMDHAPVCGMNGHTYQNRCVAICNQVHIHCEGPCPCHDSTPPFPDCHDSPGGCSPGACGYCPKFRRPVCGNDGKTYVNACFAFCMKGGFQCIGKCPCESHECPCTKEYHPVCGNNGKTYGNACIADCAGIPISCEGVCPCPKILIT